jgi:hypothetical protein
VVLLNLLPFVTWSLLVAVAVVTQVAVLLVVIEQQQVLSLSSIPITP